MILWRSVSFSLGGCIATLLVTSPHEMGGKYASTSRGLANKVVKAMTQYAVDGTTESGERPAYNFFTNKWHCHNISMRRT